MNKKVLKKHKLAAYWALKADIGIEIARVDVQEYIDIINTVENSLIENKQLRAQIECLMAQRDALGDSLHNQSPGILTLEGYTPTWAREMP